jgi:hypothetical protein
VFRSMDEVIERGACLFCGGKLRQTSPEGQRLGVSLHARCADESCTGSIVLLKLDEWNAAYQVRQAEVSAAVRRSEEQARSEIAAILNNQSPPSFERLIFDPITVRVGIYQYAERIGWSRPYVDEIE